jgi:hypothetical protein
LFSVPLFMLSKLGGVAPAAGGVVVVVVPSGWVVVVAPPGAIMVDVPPGAVVVVAPFGAMVVSGAVPAGAAIPELLLKFGADPGAAAAGVADVEEPASAAGAEAGGTGAGGAVVAVAAGVAFVSLAAFSSFLPQADRPKPKATTAVASRSVLSVVFPLVFMAITSIALGSLKVTRRTDVSSVPVPEAIHLA